MTTIRHIAVVRILQLEQYIKSKKYQNTFQHYATILEKPNSVLQFFKATIPITNEYQKVRIM